MQRLVNLKHMMLEEVEEMTEKDSLSYGDIDLAYKITDVIKDIDTIVAMNQGYSSKAGDDSKIERMMDDLHLSLDERSALRKAMSEIGR